MANRNEVFFSQYAKDISDSDNINANKDYSVTPAEFEITAPSGYMRLVITRMILFIEDSGTATTEEYGSGPAITNGIELFLEKNGEETDLMAGMDVKTNGQWKQKCYDITLDAWGNGNKVVSGRWTFAKSGTKITLRGADRLVIRCSDDLTHLINHTFLFQGYADVDYN